MLSIYTKLEKSTCGRIQELIISLNRAPKVRDNDTLS